MAGLEGRTQFDDLEDELLKWTTEWDFGDDAIYAAAKAARLNRQKIALLTRYPRKRRRPLRSHAERTVDRRLVWHAHVYRRWGHARV